VKVYGRVVDEQDPAVRAAFRDAIRTRMDWAPDEPEYHCFSVDVSGAGFVRFGDGAAALAWDEERGLRRLPAPG